MAQKVKTPKVKKATKTVVNEPPTTSKMAPASTSLLFSSSIPSIAITAEQRHRMIAEAAYVLAEQRGFNEEGALEDWLQAEAKIDNQIATDNVR